jgi:tetratricopeptide (TPR) repeat protein
MKTTGIILFGLLVLATLKIEAIPNTQTDSIQYFIREFKYHEALSLINRAIEKDQSSKELYQLQGNVLRGMYAYDSSIKSYLKALSIDSTDKQILIETANTYKLIQDYQNALHYYSKASINDTSNVLLRMECANCKFLGEQYSHSNGDFMKIYKEDTLNYFAIKRLAVGYNKVNHNDTSILFFKRAITINPFDASNVTNLCNILITNDKYQEGIDLTENYRLIDSTNQKVNSVNAYLYLLNKQYKTAIEKFNKCIATNDSSRFVLKNLGISYFKNESFDTAKFWLEKAYVLDTTDVLNLQFLGITCSQAHYSKLGIFYLEKALEQYDPMLKDFASIYRNLAEIYRIWTQCSCEKRLDIYLKAYELNPKDSLLAFFIGAEYDNCKKDYHKAIEFYKIYLKTKPPVTDPIQLKTLTYAIYANTENRVKVLKEYLKKKQNL